jgi:hypothetical protein
MKATAFRLIQAEQAAPLPRRIESEAIHVHEARLAAIKRLGKNWVKHPAYTFNPRHSHNPEVYEEARAPYLADISRRAAADRERRESFQSAQRVRVALRSQP